MATSTLLGIGTMAQKNSSPNLAISGLASGMDWATIVTELATAERAPETQWQTQQTAITAQNTAYSTISADLNTLQLDTDNLVDPSFFDSVTAASSDTSVASASVSSGTPIGDYAFNISQLATAAQLNGTTHVAQVLDPSDGPGSVTIGSAGFSTPITAGTFTVNGARVTIATTDSLQDVFDAIATATGNKVTASYDANADKINLTSSDGSPITLGSSTDTSNFLQVAQLYNDNGDGTENTGAISSTTALGHVNLEADMTSADLAMPITNGGSSNGAFEINGVSFSYNADTDSIQDILNNINQSAAGVSAAYDPINNRFLLTNTNTGDVGISTKDVTGNFLAATGLASGTLTHGENLVYTLNGGTQPIISQSNTIDSSSSGIIGLSVAAATTGLTTVTVKPDTTTISNAIQQFVTDYNTLQTYMNSQQAVTTGANGAVTPGTLTGDQTTTNIASSLRSVMASVENIPGTSGAVTQLADLGFSSDGSDNNISLSDSNTLSSMLTGNLSDVQALFSDPKNGLAKLVSNYITTVIGTNGTLPSRTSDLNTQSTDITTQISNLESKITSDTNQWDSEFQNMETAESQTNQELTYLSQGVSSGSL
jgi:flagellar hook-associated protein 2